jgi:hypothetical protein
MAAKSALATGRPLVLSGVIFLAAGLGACGAIDDALFSGSTMEAAPGESGIFADTESYEPTDTAVAPKYSGPVSSPVRTIAISDGAPTGTAVGQQIQQVRTSLIGLQNRIRASGERLAQLRAVGANAAANYSAAKSTITSRLQLGTTRGNPELVAQWNSAQDSLDQVSSNINALNSLGTDVSADAAQANFTLNTIRGMYNVSGAVDEDHRQLSVLEDETSQSIVVLDRLLTTVTRDIQRATNYVANERASLTMLANAIKNGEMYGEALMPSITAPQPAAAPRSVVSSAGSGTPLVVIKFDRPNVEYQQILYTALAQALERRPEAGFQVVAVAPSASSAATMQTAQAQTQRNAQAVLRSMTDMGVPASRLALMSTTDPGVSSSEVRVYMR